MDKQAAGEAAEDGKARVNAQVAALALRSAAQSGVSKGSNKGKKLTSKQKKRRDQMMEKGSAFTEKLSQKALETELSQKNVKQRASDWDQINEKAMAELYDADERVAKISPIAAP